MRIHQDKLYKDKSQAGENNKNPILSYFFLAMIPITVAVSCSPFTVPLMNDVYEGFIHNFKFNKYNF